MFRVSVLGEEDVTQYAEGMEIGDLAVIVRDGRFKGQVILRHFGGWVSLTSPTVNWSAQLSAEVKILPSGTIVKLTVHGGNAHVVKEQGG